MKSSLLLYVLINALHTTHTNRKLFLPLYAQFCMTSEQFKKKDTLLGRTYLVSTVVLTMELLHCLLIPTFSGRKQKIHLQHF